MKTENVIKIAVAVVVLYSTDIYTHTHLICDVSPSIVLIAKNVKILFKFDSGNSLFARSPFQTFHAHSLNIFQIL